MVPSLSEQWNYAIGVLDGENELNLTYYDSAGVQRVDYGNISDDCSTIIVAYTPNSGIKLTKQTPIDYVHVVWMSHLDVGYDGIYPVVGYIINVLNVYFMNHLPRGVFLYNAMKALNYEQGFIYTQHPWLLYLYLECPKLVLLNVTLQCPTQEQRQDMINAIKEGGVTWHAGAFNVQFEAFDSSLYNGSLQFGTYLDEMFNKTRNYKVVSNRDVPGATRGVVPLLIKNGIKALTVGENGGSPFVAKPIFLWKDYESGEEIIAMWHAGGYGGIERYSDCITLSWSNHALCFQVLGDNSGPPQSIEQILNTYAQIEEEFPGAKVFASTWDNYIEQIYSQRSKLPTLTQEIGDVWMQGVSSDLLKFQVYREMTRQRASCFQNKQCDLSDSRIRNFDFYLIKLPEHTWGLPDCGDNTYWSNSLFHPIQYTNPDYINNKNAWEEQRTFAQLAFEALEDHPLAQDIETALKDLIPPETINLSHYNQVDNLNQLLKCGDFTIQFDGEYGSLIVLDYNNRNWANKNAPFFELEYTTYDETDFNYMEAYYGGDAGYNKHGSLNYTQRQHWYPRMRGLYTYKNNTDNLCSIIVELEFESTTYINYGTPTKLYLNVIYDNEISNANYSNVLDFELIWYNKTSTRLPESMMVNFYPMTQSPNNEEITHYLNKLDSYIEFTEVMLNGSQYQHGVWNGIYSQITEANNNNDILGSMYLLSLDSCLACPITNQVSYPGWFGTPTPFPVPLYPLNKNEIIGYGFNLYNNIWNTNYALWYPFTPKWDWLGNYNDANAKFRFTAVFE